MGTNINNYNLNDLKLQISNKDYWDFYLANGGGTSSPYTGITLGSCFTTHFDFNNPSIYSTGSTSADTIYSLVSWDNAVSTGVTIDTIGITGIDNGLITFNKTSGDTTNQALLSALTQSVLTIPSGETRFIMNRVTGMTGQYEYPIEIIPANALSPVGAYAQFCGGFYQGYYKLDGYDYEVLPNRVPKGWAAELWVNKSDSVCSGLTATTLNDTYPNNKGFFFYMGTRAENKFWTIFDGVNTGCTSGCTIPVGCTGTPTTFCTVPKESEITLVNGHALSPPPTRTVTTDNAFLIYNRGRDNGNCNGSRQTHYGITYPEGQLAPSFTGGSITYTAVTQTSTDNQNPFLVYCRSHNSTGCAQGSTGTCKTVRNYNPTSALLTLDVNSDIIDNAIGFRIKDDGNIGYRLLTVTGSCVDTVYSSGVTVTEKYTSGGTVTDDDWTNVTIRFFAYDEYNEYELECGERRLGRLSMRSLAHNSLA